MIPFFTLCFFFNYLAFSEPDFQSQIFIPDKSVELVAQKFDSLYFPLFLKSFAWMNHNDTSVIGDYYEAGGYKKEIKIPLNLNDPAKLKLTPVYRFYNPSGIDFPVKFPISWSDTIHTDPTWRLWFQSLVWLKPYLKSSENDSVTAAFYVINDWISSHLTYPVSNERYAFDDHAVSERMIVLQLASSEMQKHGYDEQQFQTKLLLALLNHIFFISSLEKYSCWHNHAIIFDSKLITVLKRTKEFKKRDELLNLAFSRVFEQYRYAYTSEGVHKEHSPCYHKGFTETLNSIVSSAAEFNIQVPAALLQVQKKANKYCKCIDLLGKEFPVGDCARLSAMKNTENQDDTFTSHENTENHSGIANNPVLYSKKCQLFPRSGWMYVYDTIHQVNIVAQSDFFGYSHYQQDETSFIITVAGNELIIDPGLYSYSPSPIYNYYRSPRAHNMLVVDGISDSVDFRVTGLSGITRHLMIPDENGSITGGVEMTHALYQKNGVDVHRQFIFPGDYEMVVRDVVRSKDKHTYRQLFHLAPDAMITQEGNTFIVKWSQHSNYLVIKSKFDSFRIVIGQNEPLQGWYFPSFNEIQPSPVLELIKEGADCELATSISIVLSGAEKPVQIQMAGATRSIISALESTEPRTLIHQPFPERWKPAR